MSKRLVVFAPNWLGDAVMALPAIADLVRAGSDTRVDIAARPSIAPLFSLMPGIGDVLVLDRPGNGHAGAPVSLPDRSFDAALLLPNSFQAALTAWRAGIPERWGYRAQGRTPLLTRAIAKPAARVHQARYYQRLTESLGFASGAPEPRLDAPADIRRAGLELLASAGWDGRSPLVALAPGAAQGTAKRWPAASFSALAQSLGRDGVTCVLVGSGADAAAGTEVEAGTPVINVIGRTDLPALAGVLAACRALVSNDSGAMHFGAALGVPVIAIFGPTDERETRPTGAVEPTVLTHPVWCRPCMLRECPLTHRCMRGVTTETVRAAVQRAS
jgi:heptosyltransferase-2